MRTLIYSLRSVNDKSKLVIDLNGIVISETQYSLQIKLPTGMTIVNKFDYLNTLKVYDDGKIFFIICTKKISRDTAFQVLMQYAIEKIETTIDKYKELGVQAKVDFLEKAKEKYLIEISSTVAA